MRGGGGRGGGGGVEGIKVLDITYLTTVEPSSGGQQWFHITMPFIK